MIPLPECRHRETVAGHIIGCKLTRPPVVKIVAPRGVTAELCAVCPYCDISPPVQPAPRTAVCTYLGDQTELRDCVSCGNKKTKIKVFACSHPAHVETTWQECQSCVHYVSRPPQSSPPPASPAS